MGRFNLDVLDLLAIFQNTYTNPILTLLNAYVGFESVLVSVFFPVYTFSEILLDFLFNFLVLKTFSTASVTFAFKFVFFIATLVFVRGGIPRYRYDFLTKLG